MQIPHLLLSLNQKVLKVITKQLLLGLVSFLFLSVGLAQTPSDEAIENLNKAIDLYNDQKFDQAIVQYSKALSAFPTYKKAYKYRANAHIAKKDFENAARDLEQALKLDPSQQELYGTLASVYYNNGKPESVMETTRRAESQGINNAVAIFNRGLVYLDRGDDALAKRDFDIAIGLDQSFAEAFYNRGLVLQRQENAEAAIADFSVAIQKKSSYPKARFARAKAHFKLKNFQDALNDLNVYLAGAPENGAAYKARGHVHYELKKYAQAIADYNLALAYFPMDRHILYNRAGAHMSLQKYNDAIRDLTLILEQEGPDKQILLERGYANAKMEAHEDAIQDYSRAIQIDGQFVNGYYYRGQSYLVLKNYELGCSDLQKARKMGHEPSGQIMKEHCKKNK